MILIFEKLGEKGGALQERCEFWHSFLLLANLTNVLGREVDGRCKVREKNEACSYFGEAISLLDGGLGKLSL